MERTNVGKNQLTSVTEVTVKDSLLFMYLSYIWIIFIITLTAGTMFQTFFAFSTKLSLEKSALNACWLEKENHDLSSRRWGACFLLSSNFPIILVWAPFVHLERMPSWKKSPGIPCGHWLGMHRCQGMPQTDTGTPVLTEHFCDGICVATVSSRKVLHMCLTMSYILGFSKAPLFLECASLFQLSFTWLNLAHHLNTFFKI